MMFKAKTCKILMSFGLSRTSGMEWWNGTLEWNTGMEYWNDPTHAINLP